MSRRGAGSRGSCSGTPARRPAVQVPAARRVPVPRPTIRPAVRRHLLTRRGTAAPRPSPYATGMTGPTLHDALTAALDAYDRLGLLGEDIEDEWTYVTDLGAAWRERLEAVDAARGGEPAGPAGPCHRPGDRRDRPDRGPASRHRLAVHLPAGRPAGARGAAVRFQDAAKDAPHRRLCRDPGRPARGAGGRPAGRRDPRPARAGPGRHERRVARPGRLARRCSRRCSRADGPAEREPVPRPSSSAPWRSPIGATRSATSSAARSWRR